MTAITVAGLTQDPHPLLARLRAQAPVAWVPALGGYVVSTREAALAVMRDDVTFTVDDERFSTARVVGPSMLSLDGEQHARHRAPFARAWRREAVADRLQDFVADEARRLVAVLAPAGEGELRAGLAAPLAVAAMQRALGLESVPAAELLGWYEAIVDAVSAVGGAGGELPASGPAAYAALRDAVRTTIAEQAPALAPGEAASNAAILLFGGIETTEGMIANVLWHLLGDADALAAVRADRTLIAAAVEESLRLEPAAAVVDRYATRASTLAGTRIEAGALVVVSLAAANRDPAAFADADRFVLRRTDARRHVAFAAGPHVCLGMHLARTETVAAVAAVLDGLPELRLDAARSRGPQGLVFRKALSVHARWGCSATALSGSVAP